ncbi:hypothetical protein AC249_AIPGENE25747 [Exaiptasia diaphana]|nr:hypothetical protein AC249_AIPGENE25747 [Exaiptasia diaphana]
MINVQLIKKPNAAVSFIRKESNSYCYNQDGSLDIAKLSPTSDTDTTATSKTISTYITHSITSYSKSVSTHTPKLSPSLIPNANSTLDTISTHSIQEYTNEITITPAFVSPSTPSKVFILSATYPGVRPTIVTAKGIKMIEEFHQFLHSHD